ncbi:MAG: dihydrofolate reductase family protein [Candidatus Thermoplasmatota archaeon]|nr:dihydrofolate reductase family protein [Candidatus Thermoplasmatota archaeon]MBU1941138.1 dihydrofolate reductase family protein [Candidatus Thermoplasmatota archaeon]
MRPKIIMHNTISLDGSLTNFCVNMELHYRILGTFNADAHLIGSNTAKSGLDLFLDTIPPETPKNKEPPKPQLTDIRPLWILIDSHAQMYNLLHIFRQYEFCKDVIVLITSKTPAKYSEYLTSRHYHIIRSGTQHVNLNQALEILHKHYHINTIVTDTGHTLNSILLRQGLLDEISLIINPVIVGQNQLNVFKTLSQSIQPNQLHLLKSTPLENNSIHLHYEIIKNQMDGISS